MTTEVLTLNSLSTNSEIREAFKDNTAFQAGEVIIASIEDTRNPNVKALLLVQQRKDLKITATTMNPLVQLTMGLKPIEGRTLRCWHNIDDEILASLKGVKPGMAAVNVFKQLDEDIRTLKINVTESNNPRIWADSNGVEQYQKPITTSNGRALTSGGKFVYQHTELAANDSMDDVLLTIDKL